MNREERMAAWKEIEAYVKPIFEDRTGEGVDYVDLDHPDNKGYAHPWSYGDATEFPAAMRWITDVLAEPANKEWVKEQ